MTQKPRNVMRMGARRAAAKPTEPEPITELVRELITKWEDGGGLLKDLAKKGGFPAKSMVSQVKLGTSLVTNLTGPRFALAFDMSYPELVTRAYLQAATKKRRTA